MDSDGDGLWDAWDGVTQRTDVNNDSLPDLVGFANAGTYVALNTGTAFQAASRWSSSFGYDTGWRVEKHPRTLVDVNNDSLPDLVGFANAGTYVALNTGTAFQAASRWSSSFGYDTGWRVEKHPRTLVDVNNDSLPDLVGFANAGTYVALNTGTAFQAASRWSSSFGYDTGWRVEKHPRTLVDVNNDSLPDLVGFANAGTYVALNTGTAFQAASRWSSSFGYDTGWRVEKHPRMIGGG